MALEYLLVDVTEGRSQLNGGRFWRLTFVAIEDGQTYEMTVDPAYDNFKRNGWDHVVGDEYPYGVYTGLRRTARKTSRGTPVISADGQARMVYRCANDAELARLVELLTEPAPTSYQELFHGA